MTERADSTNPPDVQRMNGSGFLLPKPRSKPLRVNRQRRKRMEAVVESLLLLLDEIDGDPDDEETGDLEPTTSALTGGGAYDRSGDLDEGEPPEDAEPMLGWTHAFNQTSRLYLGGAWGESTSDCEQEHDGREPDEDREPWLGSLENHPGRSEDPSFSSQQRWGSSESLDREPNGDELDTSYAHDEPTTFGRHP